MPIREDVENFKLLTRYLECDEIEDFLSLVNKCGLTFPPSDTVESYVKMLDFIPSSIQAAFKDGRMVGGIVIHYDPLFTMLSHICVHPDYRNQGIAKKLLESAEKVINCLGGTAAVGGYIATDNKESLSLARKINCQVWHQDLNFVYIDLS
jgi:ribosomal protein S18 acetylase RimI-like enzyme